MRGIRVVVQLVLIFILATLLYHPVPVFFGVIVVIIALVAVVGPTRRILAARSVKSWDGVRAGLKVMMVAAFAFSWACALHDLRLAKREVDGIAAEIQARCQQDSICPERSAVKAALPAHAPRSCFARRIGFVPSYERSASDTEFTLHVHFTTDIGVRVTGGVTKALEKDENVE